MSATWPKVCGITVARSRPFAQKDVSDAPTEVIHAKSSRHTAPQGPRVDGAPDRRQQKWLGLIEQLFPKDKWIGSRMSVLGKAHES